ncbi:N-acetyltransferase [Novymonas esmeraldas]|uniref:N-acetyltransferase n=1 Tax=Novymonas esmeraldas TaxID=1808958 RepID=A0AAW0F0C1_9TRYP
MAHCPFPRQAYYERIGAATTLLPLLPRLAAGHAPLQFLQQLILAHVSSIAFETTDVLLGLTVSLAPQDIYRKLIHAGRGGYCFEHNTLLYEALRDAGFRDVRRLSGRVTFESMDAALGRTHLVNLITLPPRDDRSDPATPPSQWLVDVGFGGGLPGGPLLLSCTEPQRTPVGVLRVVQRDAAPELTGGWTEYAVQLQTSSKQWREMYHFDLQPQLPRDTYMQNYLINNSSIFCNALNASRVEGGWATVAAGDAQPNFVPRGTYVAAAQDTCAVSTKPSRILDDALPLTDRLAPLEPTESHPGTPGELYDWLVEHLHIDFAQTRLPEYTVTRDQFIAAAHARLAVFGGGTFKRPGHL